MPAPFILPPPPLDFTEVRFRTTRDAWNDLVWAIKDLPQTALADFRTRWYHIDNREKRRAAREDFLHNVRFWLGRGS